MSVNQLPKVLAIDTARLNESYLLITMMPGRRQNRRFLSLAPWALAEYLTSPDHARETSARRAPSRSSM